MGRKLILLKQIHNEMLQIRRILEDKHESSAILQTAIGLENSVEDMIWSCTPTHIDISKYISRVENGYYHGMRNIKQYDASGIYYRLIHFPYTVWLPVDYKFDPSVQTAKLDPGSLDIATPLDIARYDRWGSHLITGCTYKPLDLDEISKYARMSYV